MDVERAVYRSVRRLADLVPHGPTLHPPDGQAVRQSDEHPMADAVVAPARHTRTVGDGDLAHAEPLQGDEGREEAMDALEEADVREALAPEGPVRAPGVTDVAPAE